MVNDRHVVEIIDAQESDLEALATLFNDYRAFYDCTPDLQSARHFVSRRIKEKATRFFLAILGGAHVGFVHLLPSFDTLAMRSAWILEDLFVDPAHRRCGVGSALLRHAEAFAVRTDAARLSLTTAHTNEIAQRLYLGHGYVHDEVFRAYHRMLH